MSMPEHKPVAKQQSNSLHMIATLAGVSVLSGILIVLTDGVTHARIESNKRNATEQAVFKVLPGATSQAAFEKTADGFKQTSTPSPGADMVYAGYDAQGGLVGVAFQAASNLGYSGLVEVMCGYAPAKDAVIGYTVLHSLETPGLGSRVDTDPQFLKNFEDLDVKLDTAGSALAHPIVLVKNGAKTEPWQIDGISGATISSRAVTDAVSRQCAKDVPFIKQHLNELSQHMEAS